MDFILMKYSMVISDMLYILQHFNLNFISFFIVNAAVVFYNYPGENSFLGCYWVNVFSIIGVMLKKILGQYTFL